MPVPDVICTKGRQAGTSTHQEKGFHTHPVLIGMMLFFALAYAISFSEMCGALRHRELNLDDAKDKI